jgi:hypothetical protein
VLKTREQKSSATLGPEEQLANWRSQMTPEERHSLLLTSVKGKESANLLGAEAAKDLAIEHLSERASVARELHTAGMLLRSGIGRVSVEEARVFANADTRFMRPDPNRALVTTRDVFAEETAMIGTTLAGQERCEAIECGKQWTISSPIVAQSEEQAKALYGF